MTIGQQLCLLEKSKSVFWRQLSERAVIVSVITAERIIVYAMVTVLPAKKPCVIAQTVITILTPLPFLPQQALMALNWVNDVVRVEMIISTLQGPLKLIVKHLCRRFMRLNPPKTEILNNSKNEFYKIHLELILWPNWRKIFQSIYN